MGDIKYGSAPEDMGIFDIVSPEMKYFLYLPIKIPRQKPKIPPQLQPFQEVLDFVWPVVFECNLHMYITVKTMFVDSNSPGNRPGWHADGYNSNGDLNYIWYDMNPTEFAVQEFVDVPNDDAGSMQAFEAQSSNIITYPCKHLLKLDESVIHRVGPVLESGVRTFAKITISKHRFNRVGNSINYGLDYDR